MVVASVLLVVVLVAAFVGYGAYKVLVIDTPRYAKYWQDRAAETIKPGSISVLALGDSTFQAIGATKPQFGTVGRIVSYLEEQTGRPVHVKNLSVSGARAVNVANDQLARADFSTADVVVIAVGANDAIKKSDLSEFTTSIEKIAAAAPAEKTIMADVAMVKNRDKYQSVLDRERSKNNIASADLKAGFKGVTGSWRLSARDFFHPSDYGYQFWFKAFVPSLDQLIPELDKQR